MVSTKILHAEFDAVAIVTTITPMRLIGLTGGIGVGKSTVGDILEEQSIPVIRADDVGRDVLTPGQDGFNQVVEAFGPEILGGCGMIDRRRLGKLTFANPLVRARVDSILHPLIRRRSHEMFVALKGRGADVAVYESALLFALGRDREMDLVVLVTAPKQARITWVCARDGISFAEAEQRMSAQI